MMDNCDDEFSSSVRVVIIIKFIIIVVNAYIYIVYCRWYHSAYHRSYKLQRIQLLQVTTHSIMNAVHTYILINTVKQ